MAGPGEPPEAARAFIAFLTRPAFKAKFAATLRAGIDTAAKHGDMDTSDMFTEASREVDKALWFLEAHLQA